MSGNEAVQDLMERYLWQVGERLPGKMRGDVVAELRANLAESMAEQGAADAAGAGEILRQLGDPAKVAMRYAGENYLIGPRLFPVFCAVAQWITLGLGGLYLFLAVFRAFDDSASVLDLLAPGNHWLEWVGVYAKSLFTNLALLVAGFAVAERVQQRWFSEEKEWDPASLPALPEKSDPQKVAVGDMLAGGYFTVALFCLVNFRPEWVWVTWVDGGWPRWLAGTLLDVPLPMPWLNVSWVLTLALYIEVLRRGRWIPPLRWAELGLGLFGAWILTLMIGQVQWYWMEWLLRAILAATILEAAVRLYRIVWKGKGAGR